MWCLDWIFYLNQMQTDVSNLKKKMETKITESLKVDENIKVVFLKTMRRRLLKQTI